MGGLEKGRPFPSTFIIWLLLPWYKRLGKKSASPAGLLPCYVLICSAASTTAVLHSRNPASFTSSIGWRSVTLHKLSQASVLDWHSWTSQSWGWSITRILSLSSVQTVMLGYPDHIVLANIIMLVVFSHSFSTVNLKINAASFLSTLTQTCLIKIVLLCHCYIRCIETLLRDT